MTKLGHKEFPNWAKIAIPVLSLIVGGLGIVAWNSTNVVEPTGSGEYKLSVQKGDSLISIANKLEQNNVIKSADALRYTMKKQGTDTAIQEGTYDLSGQMTIQEIAKVLSSAPNTSIIKIVVPEGKRIKDIIAILDKNGFDKEELEKAFKDTSSNEYIPKGSDNLEGFAFPATYELKEDTKAQEIVNMMTKRMQQEFSEERIKKAESLGLNVYSWITLASMVQAEAANNEEMPIIAGVFLNRLRDNIALGSDPTVAYGLGKNLPELDRNAGDFEKDHPWNTYTRKGIPKGPINNPGKAALVSILEPVRTLPDGRQALYFLHGRDGKIYLNNTFQEHISDNQKYR